MHRKSQKKKMKYIAGVISLAVIVTYVGVSSSLRGQVIWPGGMSSDQNNTQKPDLSITRSASDSVSWDGTYAVRYTVTNRGAAVRQASSIEPYFTGAYDSVKRVYVSSPISYAGVKSADGIEPNRIGCGIGGGNLRCILFRGINAGETLEFTVFYEANKMPVQCDRVLPLGVATVAPGMNLTPFTLQTNLRNDANPSDNTSASIPVRIDCESITGDLETEVTGPDFVAKDSIGEFTVTLRNIGSVVSGVVPVQISSPNSGFEVVSITGKEQGGICGRVKNSRNQFACSYPSIQLAPGQEETFSLKLKALAQECGAKEIRAEIMKSLKTPTPRFREIYDPNDANNVSTMKTRCHESSGTETTPPPNVPEPEVPTNPTTPDVPTYPKTPLKNPYNWGAFY